MILSYIFLFFIILACAGTLFYLYEFFIPSLKLKYSGINENLDSDHLSEFDEDIPEEVKDLSKIASVQFSGTDEQNEKRMFYKGEKNCSLFYSVYTSEFKNQKICIGYGDCIKSCPQKAIMMQKDEIMISEMCNGCGKCISSCPVNLISLVPKKQ